MAFTGKATYTSGAGLPEVAEDVSDLVSSFRFRRVIVTHMDRTHRLGAALAACMSGAQLAHVAYGPRPEDALEMLEPGTLAAQILDVSSH